MVEILVDGVLYVPINQQEQPHKQRRLMVGDFVKVVGGGFIRMGMCGEVVFIYDGRPKEIGVQFPSFNEVCHDLSGRTKPGHGWWYNEKDLELVP